MLVMKDKERGKDYVKEDYMEEVIEYKAIQAKKDVEVFVHAVTVSSKCGLKTDVTKPFKKLKLAMNSTPVLALPYFTMTLTLEIDASAKAIGVVIMQ
ncbi:hypothetical protein ACH5RR_026040 [Cinchona calisaya]|uniref:Reverse transcriptase/retrotransposon-derived protein RNase H-like domain-containing protein n=1 Tax=Cinchona calisaya TaxID=153742 RepID=A0ABD2Z2I7_9GENT